MFTLAVFTGMRISEFRVLVWGAVDFDRQIIKVMQRADEFGELGAPTSRAGEREIPMAPTIVKALTEWKTSGLRTADGLVFPDSAGKIQNYSNICNRVFKPMLVANGITDDGEVEFGIHALRHAAVPLFIEQVWNAQKMQTLLGHASINMTMDVYGHLFEKLENFFWWPRGATRQIAQSPSSRTSTHKLKNQGASATPLGLVRLG